VNYGATAQFTNVKPNTGYNDTNSISCTNSQTASKSSTTVTTGAITNNTVCTVSFPIKTFSVQLVTTNGTGGTTKTVNYGATAQFTNVKPNSNYNDTNSISCTNSQTASKSSTTVTTGAITNNTVCTISFPIKTYSVQLKVTNGSGATTKTVNHGSTTTFSVSANNGYSYSSLSCTNSQSASISGNTVTTGAITNNTVCTLTYTDQTTPTISVISGHYDYYDTTTLYSASFGVTGGTVSCVNQSNNNAAVSKVIDLGAIGRNTVKCTATGKNGKTAQATQTIYVDLSRTGNQMNYTTGQCGSYVSGTSLYLKQKCSAGFDWQFGPYVTARAGSYKVTYYVYNMREDGSYSSNTDITVRPTYNFGQNVLSTSNSLIGTGTIYYNTTVPSGGVSNFEVTIGNNTNYQVIIYNYKIEAL